MQTIVSCRRFRTGCLALLALTAALVPNRARAAYVMTLSQVGPDVVVTGSGSINYTALANQGTGNTLNPTIWTTQAILYVGSLSSPVNQYANLSGPASFGQGQPASATSGTGNFVGIFGNANDVFGMGNRIYVPSGYVSGAALQSTATFANATFTSLGFNPGTYVYTWGTGATADSLTVTGAAPEPGTWALLGLGGACLLALGRRQRQRRTA